MIKLPEPVGITKKHYANSNIHGDRSFCTWKKEDVAYGVHLYTKEQVTIAVLEAIELAAQAAGPEDSYQDDYFKGQCRSAERVRKLKEGL